MLENDSIRISLMEKAANGFLNEVFGNRNKRMGQFPDADHLNC